MEYMNKPQIYLCNDDGIDSPGLKALAEALYEIADLKIFAPSKNQTAQGRSISGKKEAAFKRNDIVFNGKEIESYSLEASPALVVAHAISIFPKPDLMISGINYGENLGTNVTHSGTLGSALEAACFGIPSLAVSRQTDIEHIMSYEKIDWSISKLLAKEFALKIINSELPFDADVIKVDVPECASENTDIRLTRLSRASHYKTKISNPSIDSKISDAVLHTEFDIDTLERDSDIYAVMVDKVISVTPISFDLTSRIDFTEFDNNFIK